MSGMFPLKAVVKNGRLLLDEPTELPDGTELELVPLEDEDELDPEDHARLMAAINEGIDAVERGDTVDGFELIARLRAKHEAAGR